MTVNVFTVLRYLRAKGKNGELLFENDYFIDPAPIGEIVKWGFGPLKQETFFQSYPKAEFQKELSYYLKGASSVETWRRYVLLEQRSRIDLIMRPGGKRLSYLSYTSMEIFPFGSFRIFSPREIGAMDIDGFIEWHERQMIRGIDNAFQKDFRLSSRY